jgi:guanine deaminase
MKQAWRAAIFHCVDDPLESADPSATEYYEDGILVVENGNVTALGDATELRADVVDTAVEDLTGKLIVPGFIDCHVHFPQVDIIASYGEQLLDWLKRYAYPAESRYADTDYAHAAADFFLDELLKNGTTTACVFPTVHPQSVDAIFATATKRGMRLISGKVLMDSHCPKELQDNPQSAYDDSRRLIERWHGRDRLAYAITPRFAVTSSEAQLEAAGQLAKEYPDTWVHSHLAENADEIAAVSKQFPWSSSYLDVYDRYDLVRERSVFAHCLHLSPANRLQMGERGAAAAFCPTSNLFLGSGLFDLGAMSEASVRVGLATDVGGGTSLSMLQTMNEAYKVLQMQRQSLPAARALYLATLGAARALRLEQHVGNLLPGKEADFVVLDPAAQSITARRAARAESLDEMLFAMIMLGDARNVAASYVAGRKSVNTSSDGDLHRFAIDERP